MLTINNLVCGYPGSFKTIPLSAMLADGETVGIIGPNGSGKTTFLKTILGILPVLSGTYKWKSPYRFGYLPQAAHLNQIIPVTAKELLQAAVIDITTGLQILGDPFDINDFLAMNFQKLSGGQKQRVLMTRTFLAQPEILFLDEPNNHVDQATQKAFWNFLKTQKNVKGIFIIDHNRTHLNESVDRILTFGET